MSSKRASFLFPLGTSVPNLFIFVVRKMPSPRVIVVRAGTYYLSKTIELGTSDSGLTIQAYENEKPIISGAMPLMNISWKEYKTSGDMNIWSADLSSQGGLLSWKLPRAVSSPLFFCCFMGRFVKIDQTFLLRQKLAKTHWSNFS